MTKLNSLAISDNGFIFKPSTGESFTTNNMGLFIINLLKEGKSSDTIISAITEEFEVDTITAERDLYDYLDFLRVEKMID
ncbi:PqqD family protein [Lutibacter sp.]|uniref:PqqD family protein n=1 Tax=Lutibacter sp. TaxID=1925666 RepID=UPI0025BC2974|nr:PqqD family protein [Lutibacter sp.]MCF6182536.1 PqqD family protein [Lutibacter sp.]